MLSREFWKYLAANPTGESLTVTMGGTGSATAKIFADKIIVDASAAEAAKTITLTTPMSFKVLDMFTIHGDTTACTVQLKNNTDAVTDAVSLAASDTDIDRAIEIDDAYDDFTKDDDDLVLAIGTGAFTGRVVIMIQPV